MESKGQRDHLRTMKSLGKRGERGREGWGKRERERDLSIRGSKSQENHWGEGGGLKTGRGDDQGQVGQRWQEESQQERDHWL